jgi:hypothetical protein
MNYSVPGGLRRSILEKLGFSGSAGGGAKGLAFGCCPAATKNILEHDCAEETVRFLSIWTKKTSEKFMKRYW